MSRVVRHSPEASAVSVEIELAGTVCAQLDVGASPRLARSFFAAAGSLNHTKALMRDMDKIAAQIGREGALFRERLQTGEAHETFAAFAERRKPNFSKFRGGRVPLIASKGSHGSSRFSGR